jgi:hypothetical protein
LGVPILREGGTVAAMALIGSFSEGELRTLVRPLQKVAEHFEAGLSQQLALA